MKERWWLRGLALLGALGLILAVFFLLVRPWYLQWGTLPAERGMPLPGDEILGPGVFQETRAIAINAPPEQVWPWLAQIGQDRGGFYSYDQLENLVGCEMPTDDRLRPAKQIWHLGDKLWMYPPEKAGGGGFATLRTLSVGYALGFGTRAVGTPLSAPEDGSWSWVLLEPTPATSRLLIRGRGPAGRTLLGRAFDRAVFEPMHFAMERRMMLGIKQLAEGHSRQRGQNLVQLILWTAVCVLWLASAGLVLAGKRWQRALASFVVSAGVFQVLSLGQPPLAVGLLLAAAAAAVLGWPRPAAAAARR
jgi:hypothetical protein